VQGLLQLRTLDGVARHELVLESDVGFGKLEVFLLGSQLGFQGLHDQSLDLGGAHVGARAAAQAVFSVHLDAELHALEFLADGVLGGKGGGSAGQFFFSGKHRANGGVGANKRALAALDAVFDLPFGHVDGAAALFAGGGAKGHEASRIHGGHGQLVALLAQNGTHNGADVFIVVAVADSGSFGGVGPGSGVFHFFQSVHALVHGGDVHVDDLVALAAVSLFDGFLKQGHGLFEVKHVGQLEEGGLHDHVDAAAEAHFLGDLDGVHVVELQLFAGDHALHGGGQVLFHVGQRPVGVQHKRAAVLDAFKDVVLGHVGGLVAGYVVGLGDQVGRSDGLLAETQVRNGETAGLLGVVSKVGLGVEIGVVADDLDGLLVGAHGAVGAEAEELALHGAGGHGVDFLFHIKGEVGDVVVDAHGEVVFGLQGHHVVEHGLGHAGREVLGTQAVTAAHQGGSFALFEEGGAYVLVQGFAKSATFLGAVKHGDGGHAGGQCAQQVLGGERTEQVNLHEAHALAQGVEVLDRFFDDFTGGTHGHDNAVGFGVTHVVEQAVFAAGDGFDLLHVVKHDAGNGVVIKVGSFTVLEVYVGVLGGAANVRMLGVHGGGAEFGHLFPVHQGADVFVINGFDLLHFVRGAETVEKVAEGQAGVDGRKVRHQGQVHAFLHGGGSKEAETGLAGSHHVLMVAKNGQGMGGQCASRNMKNAGKKFAGDFVHVGDHEQQTLRGRVGGGKSTGGKHAVHCASGASFGLHFTHVNGLAEQVFGALGGQLVHDFAHNGRGGNGVNGCRFRQSVGNVRGGVVAVHSFHMSHLFLLGAHRRAMFLQNQRGSDRPLR